VSYREKKHAGGVRSSRVQLQSQPMSENYMQAALRLAEHGRYSVSPNPMVGCVIVGSDGRVIGEGFHSRAGEAHAEIEAIRNANREVRGATVYVTLEPCAHQGMTPPCVDALIDEGVSRVVVAIEDPNPEVRGKGLQKLRSAGIVVEVGSHEDEAALLNEKFFHSIRRKLPFVLIKAGMTLDGKMATVTRRSQWITSAESRERSLRLREEYDAILIGSGTVIHDDPLLTRRLGLNSAIQPWIRVVLDAGAQIPATARLLTDGGKTLLFTGDQTRYEPHEGLEVVEWSKGTSFDLREVLHELDRRGVRSVIAEGGSILHSQLIREQLWQKMALFVAPMVIGGADAPSIFGGEGVEDLTEAFRFRFHDVERIGSDLLVTSYPQS